MNLKSIFTKRTVLITLVEVMVVGLGAFLLSRGSSHENATSGPGHTGHTNEAPRPPRRGNTNDGTGGRSLHKK